MAKKTNKNLKEVQKKKIELKQKYTLAFTKQFKSLTCDLKLNNDKKFNQIYEDLNLSKTAFNEYKSNKLPKQIETIFLIKDYFNVPFSYLFGEMNSLERTDPNVTINYGLGDDVLEILRELTEDLNSEDEYGETKKSLSARHKLISIETIIKNKKLLNLLSDYLNYSLLENKKTEKLDFLKLEIYRELFNCFDSTISEINQ